MEIYLLMNEDVLILTQKRACVSVRMGMKRIKQPIERILLMLHS